MRLAGRPLLAISLWLVPIITMIGLFLATPTLNIDDMQIREHVALDISPHAVATLIKRALLNEDIGVTQLRTYGLSRALEMAQFSLSGISAFPVYALLILLHGFGALVVFKLLRRISGDRLTALYSGIAWFSAPSILPLLKVEHHFLYLVMPYVVLMLWLLLMLTDRGLSTLASAALLTLTWALGEGAIIAAGVLVVYFAVIRRNVKVVVPAAVAFALLGFYILYQIEFVSDPAAPQRVLPHLPTLRSLGGILPDLGQAMRAVLGLKYIDSELGYHLAGIKAFKVGVTYLVGAMALTAAWLVHNSQAISTEEKREGVAALFLLTLFSVAVYALFTILGIGPLAVRYTAALYALVPLAVIGVVASRCGLSTTRAVASTLAALSLATSVGLLFRAEVLVNRPNRALLAAFPAGSAIMIHHADWPASDIGSVGVAYPGLAPLLGNGLQNPMRYALVTEPVMRMYAGVQIGIACRLRSDDLVDVIFYGKPIKTLPRANVSALGFSGIYGTELKPLSLDDICLPNRLAP